jgi:PAS domain S-box-containing protein
MAKKKHPPAIHRALTKRDASDAFGVKNEQGELKHAFEAARQITAQSCEGEQQHAASLYTRTLIEASLDPFVTISTEGKITDVNTATEQVTGCSRDELIGSDFSDYFTEPDVAREGYQQVFADGFVKDYPLAIRHKSGIITDVLYNATVYRDEVGRVQGVFAAARDITEIKRMQRELEGYSGHLETLVEERTTRLAQTEEDFRALFETSAVGQIRYDIDGRPIRMNRAIIALLGIRDVADMQYLTIFSSPRVSEEDKARLLSGYATHYEQVYDFRAIAEAGDFPTTRSDVRYFDIYMLPIFSTSGKNVEGYLAQYVDITERKEAEKALKQAERLAGIGETAAMIGHDLRNPLQALQLLVDLAQKYYNDVPAEAKEGFDFATADRIFSSVETQIQYMDKIVSDLQDYARPLTVERETVYVAALITDTLALLTIPKSTRMNVCVTDSVTAQIDPHLMQRALSNLIMNAVQAMPRGGELTVSGASKDGAVTISVHDTGDGVSDDIKDMVFSPLTTGKAKGTGLGLAVVKRIVEAHNGTITFEGEEGEGTTFIVTLPQTAE